MSALLFALLSSGTALAAEVTDMPPALRGDVRVDYRGHLVFNGIEEDGERYANQDIQRHDLRYTIEFAPLNGLAVLLSIDHTPSYSIGYPDATSMQFDPVSLGGTYYGGEIIDVETIRGSGINGVWFGVAGSPFHEMFDRPQWSSWRLQAAVRTPAPGATFYTVNQDGTRGTAPGGVALQISGAWSKRAGVSNPYMKVTWTYEMPVADITVVDEAGNTWGENLTFDPADTIDLLTGVELVSSDNRDTGSRFAVDLFLGLTYRSWEDAPSGLYLPDVLDSSRDITITVSEYLVARAGLALDFHVNKWVGLRLGGDARYHTPYIIEHVYNARTTADSFEIGMQASLVGKIRLRDD